MKKLLVLFVLHAITLIPLASSATDSSACDQLSKVQAEIVSLQSTHTGVSDNCERNADEVGECDPEEKQILEARTASLQALFESESKLQQACGY